MKHGNILKMCVLFLTFCKFFTKTFSTELYDMRIFQNEICVTSIVCQPGQLLMNGMVFHQEAKLCASWTVRGFRNRSKIELAESAEYF